MMLKVIEFRGVLTLAPRNNEDIYHRYKLGTTFSPYGDNIVLYQPELGNFPMQKGNRYGDYKLISVYLWSKCIKTKVYKKALNAFLFGLLMRVLGFPNLIKDHLFSGFEPIALKFFPSLLYHLLYSLVFI